MDHHPPERFPRKSSLQGASNCPGSFHKSPNSSTLTVQIWGFRGNFAFSKFFPWFPGGPRGELRLGLRFKLVLSPNPFSELSFRVGRAGSRNNKSSGLTSPKEAAPAGKRFNLHIGILIRAERSIFTPLEAGSAYLRAQFVF